MISVDVFCTNPSELGCRRVRSHRTGTPSEYASTRVGDLAPFADIRLRHEQEFVFAVSVEIEELRREDVGVVLAGSQNIVAARRNARRVRLASEGARHERSGDGLSVPSEVHHREAGADREPLPDVHTLEAYRPSSALGGVALAHYLGQICRIGPPG